jgi:hypothetical protein
MHKGGQGVVKMVEIYVLRSFGRHLTSKMVAQSQHSAFSPALNKCVLVKFDMLTKSKQMKFLASNSTT